MPLNAPNPRRLSSSAIRELKAARNRTMVALHRLLAPAKLTVVGFHEIRGVIRKLIGSADLVGVTE